MSAVSKFQHTKLLSSVDPKHPPKAKKDFLTQKSYRILPTRENDVFVAQVHKNGKEIQVNIFKGDDDKNIVFNGQASLFSSEDAAINYIFKHFEFYFTLQSKTEK